MRMWDVVALLSFYFSWILHFTGLRKRCLDWTFLRVGSRVLYIDLGFWGRIIDQRRGALCVCHYNFQG